ncbi:hypothetical protein PPYR_14519 [Photinus pyralis]|uniref:Protein kinase domain-containing protein n=2 Tax=Photinus pyralis TaxID=7054 RepID=A0A5N4A5F7_PHOPY|nr:hypothetical protein PPYR_14519 [Photinus pyralis]
MNYKAIAWVLLLLPHRYICTEVSEELNQNLYDALCQAECLAEGENSQCAPTQPCTTCSPLHLRELNFRRNETLTIVPQLFCKTHRAITINWESAKLLVFLLETRGNGTQWTTATMTSCSKWTMNLLKPNSDYQMRLWGVSATGEVFGPYESAWIRTTPTSYTPLQVPELVILDAQLVEKHYTALVEWKPAEDRSCFYNLVWYGNDERTMQNVQEREIREVDTLFRYRITGLELGTEYTIKIISINGIITRESNSTELSYHTPSCLDEFNSLEVCVPPAPEDLNATEELSSDDDYFNRTYRYNVQVTWSKPALFPDNYTVTINSLSTSPESKIVDGNETCATFFDVPLEPTYFIYIKASSRAGDGFADTEKRIASVKPPRSRSSQLPVIIGSVLGAIAIAIIVFLLLYRRYKISKSKRIRKLPISNCYGDDLKGKCLSEIGSAPGEYYVPEMINDEWQLKANQIVVDEILGEGAFGVVHKGYIKMVDGREVEVAIKMLKGNPNAEEVKQFEHEIEIMKSVGSHPHLVSLVGCCSKLGYLGPFLVVEYCVKGDLLSYLRAVWEHLAGQPLKSRYINTPCFVENNQMDNNFSNKIYLLGDDFILDPRLVRSC